MEKNLLDILVYNTSFEIEKGNWGHKWVGFYNGKRFCLILNSNEKVILDQENGKYFISKRSEIEMLPNRLQKLLYSSCLSNRYFLYGKERDISIEVVMTLIEKGYDINKITMQRYLEYTNGKRNDKTYLCRYFESESKNEIVEIASDKSIIWKGKSL